MRQALLVKNNRITSNIILYAFGRLISLFGTYIYNFAISLFILKITGSAKLFSISLAIGMVTKVVLSSYAGIISDKIDRKKIIVSMDIISGITIVILFLVAYFDSLRITYIFITTFILAVCNVFFDVSMIASLANVVDDKNLTKVNSLNTSIDSIAQILGPIIGGIVFVIIDIKIFLLINGISFVISGITEIFLDFNVNEIDDIQICNEARRDNQEKSQDFKVGINYLRSNKGIFKIVLFSTAINFLLQFGVVIPNPYIINNVIGLSETRYGIIQSMFSVGMLLGGILLSVLPEKKESYKKIVIGLIGFSISIVLMGVFIMPDMIILTKDTYFYIFICLSLVISLSIPLINIPLYVNMQRIIPNKIRGRVFGLITTIGGAIAPIGMILSGILISMIPTFILPMSSGIILIILSIIIFKDDEIRKI